MANIKALCIRGIRSFGPDDGDQQYITFSRPLTLILGQNGCGKTTIIECLRYAVTGQQPPGSRNECFVYDAKVNKTREVMGQAKLKVVNALGHELTVTRSMQVTSKEKKTQFKTLDGSIERVDDKGQRREISSRCADIDQIMQEELGVSKAIINSVIFCHQEDSSWPLDESKKVKERFDEIFDADRYSDCFDRLKKIRKDYAVQIKLLEQQVNFSADKKSELDKKKIQVVNTEKKIEEAELKIVSLRRDMRPIQDKLKAIQEMEQNLIEIENKKNRVNTKLEHLLNQQKELKKAIKKIFTGTDEELKRSIDNYESESRTKQQRLLDLTKRLKTIESEIERGAKEMSSNQAKAERLQLMEGQNQDRIGQRAELLASAARQVEVEVSEELEGSSEAKAALHQLTQTSRELHRKMESDRERSDLEEKTLHRLLDESSQTVARHEQKILSKKAEIDTLKKEIDTVRRELIEADRSGAKMEALQTKLDNLEREYEQLSKEMDREACQSEINEQERVVEKLDAEAEKLGDTILRLQQKSAKLAEKKALEDSIASREKSVTVLRNKHRASLRQLLGREPDSGFALAVSEAEFATKTEVDSISQQLKQKQNETSKLESERSHAHALMKQARTELDACEERLYRSCGAQGYESTLAKVDAAVDRLRDEQSTLQSSVFIINKYKSQLQENASCPLCNRGFDSQTEVLQLISELTTKVINVPSTLERVSEQLGRLSAQRDELVLLKSTQERIAELRNKTIPGLQEKLASIDTRLSALNESVEELQMTLAEPEGKLGLAKQIAGDMPLLDRYNNELQAARKELKVLADQCGGADGDISLECALERSRGLKEKTQKLRGNIRAKQSALNAHNARAQAAATANNKLREELLQLQKKTQEAVSLRQKLVSSERDLGRCGAELSELNGSTPELRRRLDELQLKYGGCRESNRKSLEELRLKTSQLDASLEKIHCLNREIEQHAGRRVGEELAALRGARARLSEERTALVAEREAAVGEADEIKEELAKQDIFKRDLEDNVKLRSAVSQSVECEREIAEIVSSGGGVDRAALADKEALIQQQTRIFNERAQTQGAADEMQKTLASLKRELSTPENREMEQVHRRQYYELQVLRALDKDIKDYSAAMDKCLMQFHRDKMESINIIIRELWRNIYRGNDIDYIEIKTGGAESVGATDRRKYEYRVVQCKNGTEIDMRGRCSAGQKVLACLIIRLALAETFSTRFGVLALDEPTTNLDEGNVSSLCRALAAAVAARAAQRNFMFVVITHDHAFIKELGSVDRVGHYFEVSRNEDGKSRIKKMKF